MYVNTDKLLAIPKSIAIQLVHRRFKLDHVEWVKTDFRHLPVAYLIVVCMLFLLVSLCRSLPVCHADSVLSRAWRADGQADCVGSVLVRLSMYSHRAFSVVFGTMRF